MPIVFRHAFLPQILPQDAPLQIGLWQHDGRGLITDL